MSAKVAAIICAAGPAKRFGGKRKKQFVEVGGRAVFLKSVELFANREDVSQILLGIPAEDEEIINIRWGANLSLFKTKVFLGGATRFETVNKALGLLKDDINLVAIHDAARCCVTAGWIDGVIKAAEKTGAAILACPVTATLKEVKDGVIVKTVDRNGLYEAQTPQVFEVNLLKQSREKADKANADKITDDSQLIEALGHKVAIVETDSSNIKITHPADVAIAEAILKTRPIPKKEGYDGPFYEAQW
ncbi:MAG: 2-C-methyl-D-erythritol 4-phosphate cytidylyltransferase [Sedimentisphaerales bacterium]|nr:2-C-methyl-D-erythritol 4-phosphate cytidylyltransferase [Sedimentisphaerales bacterium]